MEGPGGLAASPEQGQADDAPSDETPPRTQDVASPASTLDMQHLLHDLQVRVNELETEYEQERFSNGELEASRRHFADLYDFAPIVYLTLDRDCRILNANLTAATLFGRERGALVARFFTSVVAPGQRPLVRAHVRRCLTERIRVDDELSFSIRGRPIVTAQVTSVPIVESDGRVIGCKTVLVDISALKWSQQKLHFLTRASGCLASLDTVRSLQEIVQLAVPAFADVAIVDLVRDSGELHRFATAFADERLDDQLRRTRATAPRLNEGTAVGRVLRRRDPALFADCTSGEFGAAAIEHDPLLKAAGVRSVMYVPILVRGEARGLFTFAAGASSRRYTVADLSTASDLAARTGMAMENARLYEQSQRAIAARQDVLSFVSHDLRNPLMGITLTVENMLRAAPEEERRRSAGQLQRIRRAAQQMRRMIEDLLDMNAIEGGRLNVQTAVHEAGALLEEIAEVFGGLAAAAHVTLQILPPPAPLVVVCDRQRLLQVVSNLVDNALKFTAEGGSVTVSARAGDGVALFIVKDTGTGIPAAVRPHVFEQFRQAHETARQGRGLGLFIAKGLVEAQGGAIWLDSEEGVGTAFSFTLPLATAGAMGSFHPAHVDKAGPARD